MPQFQYVPFDPSGLVPSIASLIAHSADPYAQAAMNIAAINAHSADAIASAQARAREVSGDVWGRAITTAGQIPNQVMAEQRANADAAQRRALLGSEIDKNTEQVAREKKAASDQQLLGSLLPQFTKPDPITGMKEVDHEALSTAFVEQGGDPAAMEKYLQGAANTRESLEKITSAKRATATATAEAVGRQAKESSDAGDFLTRLDHLTVAGAIPPPVRDKLAQEVQAAGPDGWPAVQQRYVDWADSVVKPVTVKADETVYKGVSGTPLMTGPASRKTEAELAADAANPQSPTAAQSKSALELLRTQKNPPSLEEQYLAAKAAGETDTANLILQTWKDQATAKRDPVAAAQLEAIRNLSQQEAAARLEDRNTQSDKNQQKFEQEYRTVLQRGLSSRSGGLGLEDAKVQQANHLKSLLDQNFDPKTGEWNIPRVQLNELALGLARLTSPGGQAGEAMLKEFQQRTAKGDLAGALTYLTGEPIAANTQAITKYLAESIDRQGQTAEQNREGEMRYLRGLAPTDLAENRRQALEANSLNPLRQSRVIQNKDTGERKLQVSIDGGRTWK
jgi:hypothetical protein